MASIAPQSLAIPDYPIWRLSVEQYHEMINAGILTEADLVELLEGWLVTKMVKKPQHSLATQLLNDMLTPLLPSGWFVNVQEPITTADSEPEPDISIVRGSRRDYTDHHPYPKDVALVVEVSDATLQRDRSIKLRVYANARIPVYWILNLPDQQLEVYTNPTGDGEAAHYNQQHIYQASDEVSVIIDNQEMGQVSVDSLF
jgi:Uma2 family endonuclease